MTLKAEAKKGKREKEDFGQKFREQTKKLNSVKKILEDSYREALQLDTMIKMYPDKLKLYQMSEEISSLRSKIRNMTEEYERKNDFEEVSYRNSLPKRYLLRNRLYYPLRNYVIHKAIFLEWPGIRKFCDCRRESQAS